MLDRVDLLNEIGIDSAVNSMKLSDGVSISNRKIRIAFCPYMYGMWDSMSCIYEVAKHDPDCEVIVMPLPYVKASQDNGNEVFFDDEYFNAMNVPIVHNDINFLKNFKPDIIYVCNVYKWGIIHILSDFSAAELHKITSCLVYTSYTVAGINTERYGYHWERFINLNVLDKIIASSTFEMNAYRKAFGDNSDFNDRFLPLGSSKIDNVVKHSKSDYFVPDSWRQVLSGDKKIVLLADSIHVSPNLYFEKMKHIFETFPKDDYVLWWRQHPWAAENRLKRGKSMVDDFNFLFDYFVKNFVNNNCGIFDDTPYDTRAIVYSDICWCDYATSLIPLALCAGKQVCMCIFDKNKSGGCSSDFYYDLNNFSLSDIDPKTGKSYYYNIGTASENIHFTIKSSVLKSIVF